MAHNIKEKIGLQEGILVTSIQESTKNLLYVWKKISPVIYQCEIEFNGSFWDVRITRVGGGSQSRYILQFLKDGKEFVNLSSNLYPEIRITFEIIDEQISYLAEQEDDLINHLNLARCCPRVPVTYDHVMNGGVVIGGNQISSILDGCICYNSDILLVIDVSGSMGPFIDIFRNVIREVAVALNNPTCRMGIVTYSDFGDLGYNTGWRILLPFSSIDIAIDNLVLVTLSGGGDYEEQQMAALKLAATNWETSLGGRTDPSVNRVVAWVGDAPGHEGFTTPQGTYPAFSDTQASLVNSGIQVIALNAFGGSTGLDAYFQASIIASSTGGSVINNSLTKEIEEIIEEFCNVVDVGGDNLVYNTIGSGGSVIGGTANVSFDVGFDDPTSTCWVHFDGVALVGTDGFEMFDPGQRIYTKIYYPGINNYINPAIIASEVVGGGSFEGITSEVLPNAIANTFDSIALPNGVNLKIYDQDDNLIINVSGPKVIYNSLFFGSDAILDAINADWNAIGPTGETYEVMFPKSSRVWSNDVAEPSYQYSFGGPHMGHWIDGRIEIDCMDAYSEQSSGGVKCAGSAEISSEGFIEPTLSCWVQFSGIYVGDIYNPNEELGQIAVFYDGTSGPYDVFGETVGTGGVSGRVSEYLPNSVFYSFDCMVVPPDTNVVIRNSSGGLILDVTGPKIIYNALLLLTYVEYGDFELYNLIEDFRTKNLSGVSASGVSWNSMFPPSSRVWSNSIAVLEGDNMRSWSNGSIEITCV